MALFYACDCGRRCWTDAVKPKQVRCLACGKHMQAVEMTPAQARNRMKEAVNVASSGVAKGGSRKASR